MRLVRILELFTLLIILLIYLNFQNMPYSSATKNDIQQMLYNDVTPPFMADTDWYLSLHTASPGAWGTQATNEVSYTGYARIPVVRSGSGWTVAGSLVTNATLLQFGTRTDAGSTTATHWAIGRSLSGAWQVIQHNALVTSLPITQNITPQIAAGDVDLDITP